MANESHLFAKWATVSTGIFLGCCCAFEIKHCSFQMTVGMVVFSMLMGGVVTQLWESRNGSGGILGEEEGEISLADYQSPRPKKEGQLLPLTQHQALLLSTGAEPAKIARTPSPVNKTQVSNSPRSTPVPSC